MLRSDYTCVCVCVCVCVCACVCVCVFVCVRVRALASELLSVRATRVFALVSMSM
jgi:hypothetical protein